MKYEILLFKKFGFIFVRLQVYKKQNKKQKIYIKAYVAFLPPKC